MGDDNLPAGLKPSSSETHKEGTNQEKATEGVPKLEGTNDQLPPQPAQETVKTSPLKRNIFVKILVILLVFIFLVLGGAMGYYYFAVYDQERFAREVITFFQDFENSGQILSNTDLNKHDDYKGAVSILDSRSDFIKERKEALAKIRPPLLGPYKSMNDDIEQALGILDEVNVEAKSKAEFMAKVLELKNTFAPNDYPFGQTTPSVKDIQTFFAAQIPKAIKLGDEIFASTPPKLQDVSFEELKTSWGKTKPALQKMSEYIQSLDESADLTKINQPPSADLEEASDDINSFGRLVETALSRNSASDILSYRFAENELSTQMSDKSKEFQKKIDELKRKYGGN